MARGQARLIEAGECQTRLRPRAAPAFALALFPSPRANEGGRAPTGAGRGTPHPVARLAVGPISGEAGDQPANDAGRRAFRRSTAASFRTRAALSRTIYVLISRLS